MHARCQNTFDSLLRPRHRFVKERNKKNNPFVCVCVCKTCCCPLECRAGLNGSTDNILYYMYKYIVVGRIIA
ncbi:Uncharacterized protein APZ42_028010 [Daphnia magna]|uniref:Uncharacterized protein n=1 Tax=Daphnia magna TaxID=35525 RepID=A0A164QWI0_9CRUS|nr:Uncharacterized protein APZ42_028010 [Daphnia magna]